MALQALLAALAGLIPEAAAGAGGAAGAAGAGAAGAAGPTVASATLPSSVDLASSLLPTAQPFGGGPAESFNILQGATGGATDIGGRAAETQSALERLFGGGSVSPFTPGINPAAAGGGAEAGGDAPKIDIGKILGGMGPDGGGAEPPRSPEAIKPFEGGIQQPAGAPQGFAPTPTPGIEAGGVDTTLANAASQFLPEAQGAGGITTEAMQAEIIKRLLGNPGTPSPRSISF